MVLGRGWVGRGLSDSLMVFRGFLFVGCLRGSLVRGLGGCRSCVGCLSSVSELLLDIRFWWSVFFSWL